MTGPRAAGTARRGWLQSPPMGQLALGFRSLLIKMAVFVALASLLAWVLGGTLLPRRESAQVFRAVIDGTSCAWRITLGGSRRGPGREGTRESTVHWALVLDHDGGEPRVLFDGIFDEVAGPYARGDDFVLAGRPRAAGGAWQVVRLARDGTPRAQAMVASREDAARWLLDAGAGSGAARSNVSDSGTPPGTGAGEGSAGSP